MGSNALTRLWCAAADHFVAGIVFENGKPTTSAPILAWVVEKQMALSEFKAYCRKKKWRLMPVSE
jgi:hypothetical protein